MNVWVAPELVSSLRNPNGSYRNRCGVVNTALTLLKSAANRLPTSPMSWCKGSQLPMTSPCWNCEPTAIARMLDSRLR
ncbi:Uncharacterised protein [Mycobacterium tuberculosis]|nr:Uncharacterised protein [Mycobacterium tuberculosis]CKR84109.1 Uncharacterised protein [Mycobacterium tuberculosis]CKR84876.1 Uncharacterised protein [Mycobacterium tuberculosis]CKT54559.1 Uncharacterised protein [Mycobacterium tuberculosis]CNU65218.1 Uncharacterised protein [Mycobacterium tuberculosis]